MTCSLCLSEVDQIRNVWTNFSKNSEYEISRKTCDGIRPHTCGQTDGHDEASRTRRRRENIGKELSREGPVRVSFDAETASWLVEGPHKVETSEEEGKTSENNESQM